MDPALAIFTAIICLNVWATRRVAKYGDDIGHRKTLLIIGVWIIPIFGAWIARDHARPPLLPDYDTEAHRTVEKQAAPSVLTGTKSADFDVVANLAAPNGIPILDWRSLRAWAESNFEGESINAAIEQGRRAWLFHMQKAMGPDAHLHESDDSFILSTLEPRVVKAMAEYVATTRRRILRVLQGVAAFSPNEKCVLLILDSDEDYYNYVSIFYPEEGEFAFSGGMFINAGCPHFVAVRNDLTALEPVIAHEMTHLALSPHRLPKWLDEGIAVNTEYRLTGVKRLLYTPKELHQKHMRFWSTERIQEFWSGKSFDRTDDGNMLSYELARIIVEQIADPWENFSRFVKAAKCQDAGASAARDTLGIDLGSITAALLEVPAAEGLSPDPSSWVTAQAAPNPSVNTGSKENLGSE